MKKSTCLSFYVLLLCSGSLLAQHSGNISKTKVAGEWLTVFVTESNDTLLIKEMEGIQVSSPRSFSSNEEYRKYLMYKRYAAIVYPYALEGIRIFKDIQTNTEDLKKKNRKKFIKQLHKELKEEFTEPLKNLTKTQGKILVKMIEKELNLPLYELIKDFRGGWTATYWNILGSLNGFSLKDGYVPGEDYLLDAVIQDLDLQYPKINR